MIPQGSSVFPTEKIDKCIDQINKVENPVDLQKVVDSTYPSIQAEMDGISSQLAVLEPIVALANLSVSDLPSVVTFITNLKSLIITPQIRPITTMTQQITIMTAKLAELSAAVANANARIGASVSVPTVNFPVPTP